jgi:hypothetical protein
MAAYLVFLYVLIRLLPEGLYKHLPSHDEYGMPY